MAFIKDVVKINIWQKATTNFVSSKYDIKYVMPLSSHETAESINTPFSRMIT